MKQTVIFFLLAFCVSWVFGFIHGKEITGGEDNFESRIVKNLEVNIVEFEEISDRKVFLVYSVNEVPLYYYDIDSDTLNVETARRLLNPQAEFRTTDNTPISEGTVITAFGGGTAGVTLTTVLRGFNSPEKRGRSVAAFFGAISGYSFGLKIGSMFGEDLDSEEMLSLLDREENWLQYERSYHRRLLILAVHAASRIGDPGIRAERSLMTNRMMRLVENRENVDSSDFFSAIHTLKLNYQFALTSEQEILDDIDGTPFWLSWWWVGVVVLLCLLATAATFFFVRSSRGVTQDRKYRRLFG